MPSGILSGLVYLNKVHRARWRAVSVALCLLRLVGAMSARDTHSRHRTLMSYVTGQKNNASSNYRLVIYCT